MNCAEFHEALSARLDGEESAAERVVIGAHLATCAACRWFANEAARVTRLSRTTVATQEPDITLRLLLTVDGLATVLQALTDLDRVSTTCAAAMMALSGAEAASQREVSATPTVLVNGKPLPQPTSQTLREAVERAS